VKYIGAAVQMKSEGGKKMHGQVSITHTVHKPKPQHLMLRPLCIYVFWQRKPTTTTEQQTEYTMLTKLESVM
jgi:hypothetical protein